VNGDAFFTIAIALCAGWAVLRYFEPRRRP
jgi:hypothetical protein